MGKPAAARPASVLYDGACGFCSENAQKGRRFQRSGALEWVDNGSEEGQALLRERGLLGKEQDSLIVVDGDRAYLDSDAVVRSAQGLRWPWRAYAGIRFLPRRWRDAWYRRLADNRERHDACRLPAARPEAKPSPKSP